MNRHYKREYLRALVMPCLAHGRARRIPAKHRHTGERVQRLSVQIETLASRQPAQSAVQAIMCLRGFQVSPYTLFLSELGDLTACSSHSSHGLFRSASETLNTAIPYKGHANAANSHVRWIWWRRRNIMPVRPKWVQSSVGVRKGRRGGSKRSPGRPRISFIVLSGADERERKRRRQRLRSRES